jgi:hypothetical protein
VLPAPGDHLRIDVDADVRAVEARPLQRDGQPPAAASDVHDPRRQIRPPAPVEVRQPLIADRQEHRLVEQQPVAEPDPEP